MGRYTKRKRTLTAKELDWEIKQREKKREARHQYYITHKEQEYENVRKWTKEHPEKTKEYYKNWASNPVHRKNQIERVRQYNKRKCKDPLTGDIVSYATLFRRKKVHPEFYGEDFVVSSCLIKED